MSAGLAAQVQLRRIENELTRLQKVSINGKTVPQKAKVKYLGSWVAHNGDSLPEAKARVARAKQKFNKMFTLWKSKKLSKRHKCRLYTGVLSAMLYGCPALGSVV